ncbi:hypothetical protein JRO89_XS04G0194300 [Xanthoceras sorbifolium]|uniref:Geranylgeranyl transferase type II subunit beta n=1 Tax=Xanthoceras sorbifolium TaxID=99658 RepID=A0ABQ8I5Z4_9ROSI|nr:hypothetical protein JRO89_XS04G0194300 [Xanthoceras sorbifolium]
MGELAIDRLVKYIISVEKLDVLVPLSLFVGIIDYYMQMRKVGYKLVALGDSQIFLGCKNEDGSFNGDMWGEVDTRFSYIAVCCLSILHWLDKINVDKAVNYIVSCKNLDGGFGCTPGASLMQGKDLKNGGISDRPDDAVDVFHTYFGVAGIQWL